MRSESSEVGGWVERRRWPVLVGGFLLSLTGGLSYAWGSFVEPLKRDWGWTTGQATLPFTVLIIVFAMAMIPAGLIQDRIGPRKVAAFGAATFLMGYGLAGLLERIPTPTWLVLSYGVVNGIACALTYACVAPTARKWYPDRPGFAVSCGVMGFGLAATVFAPLKKTMIATWGIGGTLFALGLFAASCAFVGAWLVRNPPEGWIAPRRPDASLHPFSRPATFGDVSPARFVRTPMFYMLWLALAAVIGGGLTAIGLLTSYGELELRASPPVAALAVSFFALVNGLGRPLAGWLADRIGTVRVMMIVYTIQAGVFLTLPWIATSMPRLIICSILLGMGYAATFALFPVVVAAGFGTKHLGMNYGLVFSAFGLGAVTGLIGARLLDATGSFTPAFLLAGATTLTGLILLLMLYRKFGIR
ncbi:MAG: OFA family MFS transporter [Hadesarchaea archaeon]|nr:OFA family MFS transporter [Hadesarchaea archaeon]